ncbi:MAG: deoxyribonuclease IV [Isosphaeraceae bacterium]
MPSKIGAHMSISGGVNKAVLAASRIGFQSVQVFTKNNNRWSTPPLTDASCALFRQTMKETGVEASVAHNSYLINLASPDDTLWKRSIDAMTVEIERCAQLGIPDLVAHPGAHVGKGEASGLVRVAEGLDEIHRRTLGCKVTIDLETTAGQGTYLGHRFEHLAQIFGHVQAPERLGVCVDTCHIFAAGYSFGTFEEYDETMDGLDRSVGLSRVRVWHLNDSLREKGSRVDRHAGIGRGLIGLEAFGHIVNDPRFQQIPLILETPKGKEDGAELDSLNLQALRKLEIIL